MSFLPGSNLTWADYLRAENAEERVRLEVAQSSRKQVASIEELQKSVRNGTATISTSINEGLETISYSIGEKIREQTREMREQTNEMREQTNEMREQAWLLDWGFRGMLTGIGSINDSLDQLLHIAKTPEQTWAFEQFEIARDAFHQGFYQDALDYVNRAINGHGDHTGYRLEHRFHFLQATIYFGDLQNCSDDVLDLSKAEVAYLNAARYAETQSTSDAARAWLYAGGTAYLSGRADAAIEDAKRALSLSPLWPEASFQLAKFHMHNLEPVAAFKPLRTAIEANPNYCIKAAADPDFRKHQDRLDQFLDSLRSTARLEGVKLLDIAGARIADLESARERSFPSGVDHPIRDLRQRFAHANQSFKGDTYFGLLDAATICREIIDSFGTVLEKIRSSHSQKIATIEARRRAEEAEEAEQAARRAEAAKASAKSTSTMATTAFKLSLSGVLCWVTAPVGAIIAFILLFGSKREFEGNSRGLAVAALVVGGILTFFGVAYVILLVLSAAVSGNTNGP